MNYEIVIDDINKILIAKVSGIWKLEHSEGLANEMMDLSRVNGYTNVLIDHTKVLINVPYFVAFRRPTQLKKLFDDIKPRVAFLPPNGRYRLYHFFETVAKNRGINFKIFPAKQSAIQWLIAD